MEDSQRSKKDFSIVKIMNLFLFAWTYARMFKVRNRNSEPEKKIVSLHFMSIMLSLLW